MYNQTEAILSQYEIEIQGVAKGRGAFICDTSKGMKLLVPFRGSKEKGLLLSRFLARLEEQGFFVEQIDFTKNGEAVAEDAYTGERFLLKSYVQGTEISTSRLEEMKEAVRILAIYHNLSEKIDQQEDFLYQREDTMEILHRHYKELIKVKNYIRNRKKKNEFEQIYMRHFEHNRKSAEASLVMLEEVSAHLTDVLFVMGILTSIIFYNVMDAIRWYTLKILNITGQ